MTLTGINDSSNVVASGYEDGLLRIVFADGSVYDGEDIPIEIYAAFLAAPSKGAFVAQWLKGKLKRSSPPLIERPLELREPEPVKPLNSHDADLCCGRLIGEALRKGELDNAALWTCPKCGMDWRPKDSGGLRHWLPCPYVSTITLAAPR